MVSQRSRKQLHVALVPQISPISLTNNPKGLFCEQKFLSNSKVPTFKGKSHHCHLFSF